MFTKLPVNSLVALLAFTGNSDAFWRMSCSVIQTGRLDPIVSPGKLASHAYKIAGASNIGLSSTFEELQTANCTSCEIQADKSAYWTPVLYYQHSDGSFEEVLAPGMAVYYLGGGNTTSDIKPFPPGFRMLSGDALARSHNTSALTYKNTRPIADRVSFACLDTAPKAELPGMSDTTCKNGLQAQVHFQSCWNGKDLYKPDNSHVAYMSGIDNGECAPDYPVQFMHVVLEVLYSVANIQQDGGRFVFANGDATGFGFHGAFLNGWDPSVLTSAIASCGINNSNPSGAIQSCPAFTSDIDNYAGDCHPQPPVVKEPTTGTIAKLPGCMTITDGPKDAAEADNVCRAEMPQPAALLVQSTSRSGRVKRDANSYSSSSLSPSAANATSNSTSAAASSGMPIPSHSSNNKSTISTNTTSIIINTTTSTATPIIESFALASSSSVAPPSTPILLAVSNGYASSGCYADTPILLDLSGLTTRLLNGSHYTDTASMTVEACTAFCAKGGFPAAGVEAGQDCFCGLQLVVTVGKEIGAANCDVPCKGNTTELCGGIGALSLYMSG